MTLLKVVRESLSKKVSLNETQILRICHIQKYLGKVIPGRGISKTEAWKKKWI